MFNKLHVTNVPMTFDEPPRRRGGVMRVDSGTNKHGKYAGVPYILRDTFPVVHGGLGEWGMVPPGASEEAIQAMINEGAPAGEQLH
jgi:hypothetical protein